MTELSESSRLFEASSRLDSAAAVLSKLSKGEQTTSAERKALVWAGDFLCRVDWTAGGGNGAASFGNLAAQATEVRPTFYAALIAIERRLREAGLTREEQVVEFLRKLYQFLANGGANGNSKLPAERLQLASVLLLELSQRLLIQLTDNGLPREDELLVGGMA